MAVVNNRGQQLLIGGLVLAITLTALVIVLNGALYTEDLQTRDAAGQTLDADDYEGELSRELGRTLDRVNDRRKSDRSIVEQAVLDATFATNDLLGRQYASGQAAYATVDPVRLEDGIIIDQDATCAFLALNTNCASSSERPVTPRFTYGDDDGDSWVHAGNENIKLDATGTEDYDGTSGDLSYDWMLTEGTDTRTKSGATPSGFTLPESGFWKVTLTVTDTDDSVSRSATAWVAVHETDGANQVPPRARFSHSPTVPVVTEEITLDATATTDGNSDIDSYDWTVTRPDDSTASLSGETTTFTPATAGEYTVALDVSDGSGNTDTIRKTITVDETLANGGGRTGDTTGDGTPDPPFHVGPIPRDGYLALGEAGATPDAPDWTLAKSATVRQFDIETTDIDALEDVPDSETDQPSAIADTFYVELTGQGGKTWEVHIFESSTSGQFTVATIAPDGTVEIRHRSPNRLTVDVTTGEANGKQVFPFAPGLSRPYDIAFRNGNKISGSYELTLATGSSASTDVQSANFYAPEDQRQPYAGPAVYALNAPATYDTAELSRRGVVRVAPDEPTVYSRAISLGVPKPSYTDRDEIVYVAPSSNTLKSIDSDGMITTYDATDVQAIGPKQVDLDADDVAEIPYVASDGSLKIIDVTGEKQTLVAASSSFAPDTGNTLVSIGKWRGEFSVFYADTGSDLRRVSVGGTVSAVASTPSGTSPVGGKAVAGVYDFNGDSDDDLVFTGTSQEMKWVDNGAVSSTGRSAATSSAIGQPRTINSERRLPFVDGSSDPALVDYTNSKYRPTTNADAKKYPVALFDWNGDGAREIIYVDQGSPKTLYYVTYDGTVVQLRDSSGNPVEAEDIVGVA